MWDGPGIEVVYGGVQKCGNYTMPYSIRGSHWKAHELVGKTLICGPTPYSHPPKRVKHVHSKPMFCFHKALKPRHEKGQNYVPELCSGIVNRIVCTQEKASEWQLSLVLLEEMLLRSLQPPSCKLLQAEPRRTQLTNRPNPTHQPR